MDAVIEIQAVRTFETRTGNTRYVVRAADGNEYTTFREAIGARALELRGRRARRPRIASRSSSADGRSPTAAESFKPG
jgi:hypothetical protein